MGFFNRFKKQSPPAEQARAARAQQPAEVDDEPLKAMPVVVEMPVDELKGRLDRGEQPLIIDVREHWEWDLVHLPQATLIPMSTIPMRMSELDKNAEIIVQCHHGSRSWNVAAYLMQNGFRNVKNLTGGIDAWARRIDRGMRTY